MPKAFPLIPERRNLHGVPKTLFIEQVAALIGKTPTTIRACSTNEKYAHLIPRPFKLPNSRRLCWYEHEVLEWIDSHHTATLLILRRPRGRPTKMEQLQRQHRGISGSSKPVL